MQNDSLGDMLENIFYESICYFAFESLQDLLRYWSVKNTHRFIAGALADRGEATVPIV